LQRSQHHWDHCWDLRKKKNQIRHHLLPPPPPPENQKKNSNGTSPTSTKSTAIENNVHPDEDYQDTGSADEEDDEEQLEQTQEQQLSKKRKLEENVSFDEMESEEDLQKKNYLSNFHNQLMYLDQNIERVNMDLLEPLGDLLFDTNMSISNDWKLINRIFSQKQKRCFEI